MLAGTTGESPVLTDEERTELWRVVREAVDVPLVAGSTTNDTAHSVAMTQAAHELGMDGILAVTPYYNRPSQAGLEAHFRAVAAASPLPVLLYDIPVRTGRKISTELMVRLAEEVPTIVGVKDAAQNPAETARLVSLAAGRLRGVQRRRLDDAAVPRRRRGRPHRRGHPLVRGRGGAR